MMMMDELNTPPAETVENVLRLNSHENNTLSEFFDQLGPLWGAATEAEVKQSEVGIQAGDPKAEKRPSHNLLSTVRREAVRRAAHRHSKRLGDPDKATAELRSALKEYLERVLGKAVADTEGNIVETQTVLDSIKREEQERTGAANTFHRLFGLREETADDDGEVMEWPEEAEGESDGEQEMAEAASVADEKAMEEEPTMADEEPAMEEQPVTQS